MSISRSSDDRVVIGRIIGAHGVKGGMKILPLTDYPDRFISMDEISVERPGKPRTVLKVSSIVPQTGKGVFLLNAEGINDRDSAESFRGMEITVAKDERVDLSDDEFWIDQIIGLKVIDSSNGDELGRVEDVFPTGANDVYEIKASDGTCRAIPAIADVISEIDVEHGLMKIRLIEGLWD